MQISDREERFVVWVIFCMHSRSLETFLKNNNSVIPQINYGYNAVAGYLQSVSFIFSFEILRCRCGTSYQLRGAICLREEKTLQCLRYFSRRELSLEPQWKTSMLVLSWVGEELVSINSLDNFTSNYTAKTKSLEFLFTFKSWTSNTFLVNFITGDWMKNPITAFENSKISF